MFPPILTNARRPPVGGIKVARKIAGIIQCQNEGAEGVWDVELCKDVARQKKSVIGGIEEIPAENVCGVDSPHLGEVSGVIRLDDRWTEVALARSRESAGDAAGINKIAGNIALIINLLWERRIPNSGIIERCQDLNRHLWLLGHRIERGKGKERNRKEGEQKNPHFHMFSSWVCAPDSDFGRESASI